jgi:hypothetical protein
MRVSAETVVIMISRLEQVAGAASCRIDQIPRGMGKRGKQHGGKGEQGHEGTAILARPAASLS